MSTAPGSGAPPPPQQQQLLPKPKPTFRDALTAFYAKFNPAKLSEVPSLVQKYKGRETATIQALRVKYNVSEQALRELVAGHQRRKLQAAAARPRQQQQQQPQHQHQQQQLPRHPYQQSPTRSVTSPGVGKESGPSPESQQQLARQHGQQQVRAQKLQQRQQQLNDQERMLREQAEELETKRALIREERRKHEEEMVIVTQKRDTLRREQRQLRAEAEEQRLLQDQEAAAAHRRTRDLETQIAREQRLQQQLLLEQQARQGLAPTNGSHVEQAQAEAGIASDDHFQNDSSTSPAAGESTTGTTNAVDHSHVGANPFGIALHPEHQLRSRESAETRARNIMYAKAMNQLNALYDRHILPVEQMYLYQRFNSRPLNEAYFKAKPMVLLVGGYSVGKTTFIRYLLGRDFPNGRIGPEPVTDRFMVVMDGPDTRTVPGHALVMQQDKPFADLQKLGSGFLNKFECAQVPCEFTRKITMVDTPGILAGSKQTEGRDYKYAEAVEWFASRADRILLMFDAHKLDIGDEFNQVLVLLRAHSDKLRVVLNKADAVSGQQLMRVYGSLMWSLKTGINTPEVPRVYISSFWEKPMRQDRDGTVNTRLMESEKRALLEDLNGIPRDTFVRRINELVKRVRKVRVHALIIGHLKSKMPRFWGKQNAEKDMIANLQTHFWEVMKQHNLVASDFPPVEAFRSRLEAFTGWRKQFRSLRQELIDGMERVLGTAIPKLMGQVPGLRPPASSSSGASIRVPLSNTVAQDDQIAQDSAQDGPSLAVEAASSVDVPSNPFGEEESPTIGYNPADSTTHALTTPYQRNIDAHNSGGGAAALPHGSRVIEQDFVEVVDVHNASDPWANTS
eukprot:INCI3598.2.p1 GENE.INCI3598.2~~INCI3598.2.p1  ORF type:complete len:929 (-),score=182.83 INCI3598.2:450-2996(-)